MLDVTHFDMGDGKFGYLFIVNVEFQHSMPPRICNKLLKEARDQIMESDIYQELKNKGIPVSCISQHTYVSYNKNVKFDALVNDLTERMSKVLEEEEEEDAVVNALAERMSKSLDEEDGNGESISCLDEYGSQSLFVDASEFPSLYDDIDVYRNVTSVINNEIDDQLFEELQNAIDAIKGEIEYQDRLARRTPDEALDVPGFLTLARRYLRRAEDAWADNTGSEESLHEVRKLAAIMVRSMVYCGVRHRD